MVAVDDGRGDEVFLGGGEVLAEGGEERGDVVLAGAAAGPGDVGGAADVEVGAVGEQVQ
jgi:hypothetical protein